MYSFGCNVKCLRALCFWFSSRFVGLCQGLMFTHIRDRLFYGKVGIGD